MAMIPQAGSRAGKTIEQAHAQSVKRSLAVLAARRKGKTIAAIAASMGVSAERVRQLARKGERFEKDGGKAPPAPPAAKAAKPAKAPRAAQAVQAAPAAAAGGSKPTWRGLKTGKERRAAAVKAAPPARGGKPAKPAVAKRPLFVAAAAAAAKKPQAKRAA